MVKRCKKCALVEAYPGIQFDANGICNYCTYFETYRNKSNQARSKIKEEILRIINEVKNRDNKYDCLMGCSGGKDSSFLLYLLKEKYKLKVLAYTVDNGFLSQEAIRNIDKIVNKLDIDHIIFRPRKKIIREIYRYALTKKTTYPKELLAIMSPLCIVCHGIVMGVGAKLAIEKGIPLLCVGYTPGQYPEIGIENFAKVKSNIYLSKVLYKDDPPDIIRIIRDPINELCGEEINNYYFESQYVKEKDTLPQLIFPYQFLIDYDEEKIYKKLKNLGWKKPKDTDPCSSNCLLNSLGNYAAKKQLGYHPYATEISFLIREGKIGYRKALELERIDENSYAMNFALRELGLTKKDIIGF